MNTVILNSSQMLQILTFNYISEPYLLTLQNHDITYQLLTKNLTPKGFRIQPKNMYVLSGVFSQQNVLKIISMISVATNMLEGLDMFYLKGGFRSSIWRTNKPSFCSYRKSPSLEKGKFYLQVSEGKCFPLWSISSLDFIRKVFFKNMTFKNMRIGMNNSRNISYLP